MQRLKKERIIHQGTQSCSSYLICGKEEPVEDEYDSNEYLHLSELVESYRGIINSIITRS
jgi:hypothetical protein